MNWKRTFWFYYKCKIWYLKLNQFHLYFSKPFTFIICIGFLLKFSSTIFFLFKFPTKIKYLATKIKMISFVVHKIFVSDCFRFVLSFKIMKWMGKIYICMPCSIYQDCNVRKMLKIKVCKACKCDSVEINFSYSYYIFSWTKTDCLSEVKAKILRDFVIWFDQIANKTRTGKFQKRKKAFIQILLQTLISRPVKTFIELIEQYLNCFVLNVT